MLRWGVRLLMGSHAWTDGGGHAWAAWLGY